MIKAKAPRKTCRWVEQQALMKNPTPSRAKKVHDGADVEQGREAGQGHLWGCFAVPCNAPKKE